MLYLAHMALFDRQYHAKNVLVAPRSVQDALIGRSAQVELIADRQN